MVLTRIFTGKGDDGTTGMFFGGRVAKDGAVPRALGAVDEAQAAIGVARAEARSSGLQESVLDGGLLHLERDLYVLMAELATAHENHHKLEAGVTKASPEMVAGLEAMIEDLTSQFEPPREFTLPGQNRLTAALDLARTVARRAEREAVAVVAEGSSALPYLNRLSSVLWAAARSAEDRPVPAKPPNKETP